METPPSHPPVFPGGKLATHMPFFDGTTLVFCQSGPPTEKTFVNRGSIWKTIRHNPAMAERFKHLPRTQSVRFRSWKLAYCLWQDKTAHRIVTGLPEDGVECSPAFYQEGDRVHLSFIAGQFADNGMNYQLYSASGPSLAHLEQPKPLATGPVFYGFVSPHHVASGRGNTVSLTEKASGKTFELKSNFARIVRVSFLAQGPAKLLLTGQDQEGATRTVLHDLSTGTTSDISAGGPIYKSSLHGGHAVFARKKGEGFEDRELCHAGYTLSPSTIEISKGE